ncbi:alpha-L-fucosidase [Pelagicoccus sp. SDUM812003]|uniref:alpha-L-fucosidase n=1 Tax=Pelagicoccus sp. SDUM812003 TaxID=3041267 RepID=UPI0028105FC0|nr:alpha-L-fucosidase [Pelagicoccus sp. SDUM812003]MDQ8201409.1 alpha-L-fucosidase [Pelagicoccus sp. SDUM812003]
MSTSEVSQENRSESKSRPESVQQTVFQEEWSSIARHRTPEWFRDAKFGIYTNLGPASLATQHRTTEWYGWAMYNRKMKDWTNELLPGDQPSKEFELHRELWGDQNEFGYKDLIKEFQPTRFDAREWLDVFEKSGAKYVGPIAVHHDNYMMWDSEVTRWNSKRIAGVDMCGELEKETRKRGLKYVMTFHHAFCWWFFSESYKFDGGLPGNEDLYCRPHEFNEDPDSFGEYPDEEYEELWYRKLEEACRKYSPDLIWFDMGLELMSDRIRRKAFAKLLNMAAERQQEVGISYKIKYSVCFPPAAGILDYEKGRSTGLREDAWLTDTPLGGWYYNTTPSRSAKVMIEILIDIVSKNGCMLLAVSPKPDGSLPEDQVETLLGMGEWLEMNGEAIYETRPWGIAEEGPTKLAKEDHFNENWEASYTEKDIRFTRSKDGDTLYLIVLDRPSGERLSSVMLATINPFLDREIERVELIGTDAEIGWERSATGLRLDFPRDANGKYAWCYKLKLR